jgi:hypothetical protein
MNSGLDSVNLSSMEFSISREYSLRIDANCTRAANSTGRCIQDGDTVVTELTLGAPSIPTSAFSKVRIVAQIQALVSCKHTHAWLVAPAFQDVPLSSMIQLRAVVKDVDGLPIEHSRAAIEVRISNVSTQATWVAGTSSYLAEVVAKEPGIAEIVMTATNAWSESAERVTSCELLRRKIRVQVGKDQGITWMDIGRIAAPSGLLLLAVSVIAALLLRARRRKATSGVIEAFRLERGFRQLSRMWDQTTCSWKIDLITRDSASCSRSGSSRSLARFATLHVDAVDRFGYVPLHYAMSVNASFAMVKSLIDVFPLGPSVPDASGNLALHLAVDSGASAALVRAIYWAYPAAVVAPNSM